MNPDEYRLVSAVWDQLGTMSPEKTQALLMVLRMEQNWDQNQSRWVLHFGEKLRPRIKSNILDPLTMSTSPDFFR